MFGAILEINSGPRFADVDGLPLWSVRQLFVAFVLVMVITFVGAGLALKLFLNMSVEE